MQTATAITKVLAILDRAYPTLPMHEIHGRDPFRLLVAVILSQRARDSVTVPLASTLFAVASTPQDFVEISQDRLEEIIHPIGFYHAKAVAIKKLSQMLIEKFDSKVPATEKELLSLPSVGRKTANIILTAFFDTPQIAVDIHVHRITNRLGWVRTGFSALSSSNRRPSKDGQSISGTQYRGVAFDSTEHVILQTERELSRLIPKKYHSIVNRVFVAHGQQICLPRNPRCSLCPIEKYCPKVGVATGCHPEHPGTPGGRRIIFHDVFE